MSRYSSGLSESTIIVAMFTGLISLVVLLVWFTSYNEAASYRKYCETPVTTWDAIFLDLRIDECEKCDEPDGPK